jgi:hypothetical protein
LQKGVNDVIVLVSVFSPPVCLKVGRTKAEGCLFVDARDDNFFSACVIFTYKAAHLHCTPIPVEKGVELIEGDTPRASGAYEEQVAFCEAGLDGGDVYGLQEL